MNLGAHMSIAGGIWKSLERGKEQNCHVIQIFTKSNNQWRAATLTDEHCRLFRETSERLDVRAALAHDSYLINLASPDDALWKKSLASFGVELERAERLGIPWVVAHPGAHVGSGDRAGLRRIARGVKQALRESRGASVGVLLENTAGMGSSIGWSFAQLAELLDRIADPERTGVCFDTQHAFAAGYDWRTPGGYDAMWAEFDETVGLARLQGFHLNDSKAPAGGRLDRHEHIGRGKIGSRAFGRLMRDPRFQSVPMVLETPKDDDGADRRNLALLRRLRSTRPRAAGR